MRKRIPKLSLFALALAGILFACQHDFDEPDDSRTLTVAGARAWYEAHKPDYIELKSGSKESKVKYLKTDWETAVKLENAKFEAVETGIMSQGGWGFATEESYREWERTRTFGYMASVSKLVVLRNKEKGEMVSFVMTIVGDIAYLEKNKFNESKNNYLQKEQDFSGFVFFHNLEGKFVNGWRFTGGKATHTAKIDFDNGFGLKLKSGGCYSLPIYGWGQDCTTWYQSNNVNDEITFHMSCGVPYEVYMGSAMVCNAVDDGGGSSGGGGGSGGGYDPTPDPCNCTSICPVCGGCLTSSEVNCPPCSCPKKYLEIVRNNNLDITQTDLLEKALRELSGCLDQQTFQTIVGNGLRIDFKIGGEYTASYNPSTKTISFQNNSTITSGNLKEELFHAMQDSNIPGGTAQYTSTGKVQIEFEAKLFTDVSQIYCCIAFNSTSAPDSIKEAYQNWIFSLQGNLSPISDSEYQLWYTRFNLYAQPQYKSLISPALTSPISLNTVISQCNND